VSCDVDRTAFGKLAGTETTVTFKLWDTLTGGNPIPCGSHEVPMEKILALRPKGDKFDGHQRTCPQRRRHFDPEQ
jgi:hypothetical protein